MIDWSAIDTVLLDMDGTVLDLNYDNVLWNEHLPACYAAARGMTPAAARAHLLAHIEATRATIQHYCLDYWSDFTQLDILALHRELTHLIRWRPAARQFIAGVRGSGRRALLVTNAHRGSLGVKDAVTGITATLDVAISAHDYAAPKQDPAFWTRLAAEHPFDPARTLFIDDNHAVLAAAARYGIAHLLSVRQPDFARPPRETLEHAMLDDFATITPADV